MVKIGIHGAPRSGTTWLANLFNSNERVAYRQQPLFSYTFKGFLDENSTSDKIEEFFTGIYQSTDGYLHQIQETKDGKVPPFNKLDSTHLVYKEVRYHYVLDNLLQNSDMQLLGIIRNPLSVLSSFFQAPSEFKEGWKIDDEWLEAPKKNKGAKETYFGYLKWKELSEMFHNLHQKYGNRVTLIEYNNLLSNTLPLIEKLFDRYGIEFTEQTYKFINQSKNLEDSNPYSVFRNRQRDDKWKNVIPKKIVEYIYNDLKETELEKYLK
jgi:hypothetical protein